MIVLDASVVVKWFRGDSSDEEHVDDATAIFDRIKNGDDDVIQPVHWCAEVLAVIARKHPHRIKISIDLLDLLSFRVANSWTIYERAARLSVTYEHHLFDTLYHAVALEHGAELITADKRYFSKARELGSISLIG